MPPSAFIRMEDISPAFRTRCHLGAKERKSSHTQTNRHTDLLIKGIDTWHGKMASVFLTRWYFVLLQSTTTRIKALFPPLYLDQSHLNSLKSFHQVKQMHACISPIYSPVWGNRSPYSFVVQLALCLHRVWVSLIKPNDFNYKVLEIVFSLNCWQNAYKLFTNPNTTACPNSCKFTFSISRIWVFSNTRTTFFPIFALQYKHLMQYVCTCICICTCTMLQRSWYRLINRGCMHLKIAQGLTDCFLCCHNSFS